MNGFVNILTKSLHVTRLEQLSLRYNHLEDDAAQDLAQASHFESLELLDLNHNDIGPSGVRSLRLFERNHVSCRVELGAQSTYDGARSLSQKIHSVLRQRYPDGFPRSWTQRELNIIRSGMGGYAMQSVGAIMEPSVRDFLLHDNIVTQGYDYASLFAALQA